jgi:hypothetical protein
MQTTSASTSSSQRRGRRNQRVEFGLIYGLSFLVLLVAVVAKRLVDFVTRRVRSDAPRSIIRETREATGAAIPYAFMG